MAIHSADKLFVDVNDEINFVTEKMLGSSQDRVVIAVPQNALIISSLVSMKILAKQVVRSKKEVIIVTEDRFGMQLAERAGLVSTNKVSSITPEMWEVAHLRKEREKEDLENRKKQLLTERGILPAEQQGPAEVEPEAAVAVAPVTTEPEQIESETEPEEDNELDQEEEPEEELSEEEAEQPEEEIKGPIQRKRREGKTVAIAGFQIFAGGDVDAPATQEVEDGDIMPSTSDEETEELMEDDSSRSGVDSDTKKPKPAGGFTGRDWRSATKTPKRKGAGANIDSPSFADINLVGQGSVLMRLLKNRLLIGGIFAILVALFAGVYVLAFVINSVEIRLELKTADVPIEQQIVADPALLDADYANLAIPARIIEEEGNQSRTGQATGSGERGDKAGGFIEIWNKTTSSITLPAGTEVTSAQTGLKYVTDTEAQLPAGTEDGAVIAPGTKEVRITAANFGDEYNIPSSDDENVDFQVKGFNTDSVIGKRFGALSGGNSEEFTAVQQSDLDGEVEELETRLKSQLNSDLRSQVGSDEVLLVGSEEYEEVEKYANPDIGEEADNFTANLVLKATAYVVKKDDLDAAIAELISQNQDSEVNFEVDSLSGSSVANVVVEDGKVTFTVSSQGSLKSKIDEDQIKQEIAGLSIEDAEDYFDFDVPEVESARILYSPDILPDFLKRVPQDLTKIRLVY